MDITLPPEVEAYVQQRVRNGVAPSSAAFIEEMLRQKMQLDAWMEQKVLEAEATPLSPLTQEDLDSVRGLIRQPRGPATS